MTGERIAADVAAGTAARCVGVSVVVCCHNSAARLPPTLAHLAAQAVPAGLPCEVVVVDNASTDATTVVAKQQWPTAAALPMRVVHEPQPGLSHARRRGLAAARYEFVSFIDDDNWVCPDWVRRVAEIFIAYPHVGACGGAVEAAFETSPPAWFAYYQGNFAVGAQFPASGDITMTGRVLWGAGLSVRVSAWEQLVHSGFRFYLSGRRGQALTSGEDIELCYGLMLNGWRLWYDPALRLRHFMPAARLTWSYFRRMYRAAAWSEAWLDAYREVLGHAAAREFTAHCVSAVAGRAGAPSPQAAARPHADVRRRSSCRRPGIDAGPPAGLAA